MLRIAILLIIVFSVVAWILKKKQIKIGLTPLGKLVFVRVIQQAIRLLLRRIGL